MNPTQQILLDVSGDTYTNHVDFTLVKIRPGEFYMGPGVEAQQPVHKVQMSKGFFIGETQVNQELYQAVMGYNPSWFDSDWDNPVDSISWFDAIEFCNKLSEFDDRKKVYTVRVDGRVITSDFHGLCSTQTAEISTDFNANGYRLPTEAEFEYAAKAGTDFTYAGSNKIDEVAWYKGNSKGGSWEVELKKPNTWGIYDMSGNVWEWCSDKWDPDAYKDRTGVVSDPIVNSSKASAKRVMRGGSWYDSEEYSRTTFRGWGLPHERFKDTGLRIAISHLGRPK